MLRLTIISQSAEEIVLQADGWITGTYVELLERELRRYLQEAERLVLDLQGVRSVDRAGIALLQASTDAELTLRGGSLFVRTLLQEHGLEM